MGDVIHANSEHERHRHRAGRQQPEEILSRQVRGERPAVRGPMGAFCAAAGAALTVASIHRNGTTPHTLKCGLVQRMNLTDSGEWILKLQNGPAGSLLPDILVGTATIQPVVLTFAPSCQPPPVITSKTIRWPFDVHMNGNDIGTRCDSLKLNWYLEGHPTRAVQDAGRIVKPDLVILAGTHLHPGNDPKSLIETDPPSDNGRLVQLTARMTEGDIVRAELPAAAAPLVLLVKPLSAIRVEADAGRFSLIDHRPDKLINLQLRNIDVFIDGVKGKTLTSPETLSVHNNLDRSVVRWLFLSAPPWHYTPSPHPVIAEFHYGVRDSLKPPEFDLVEQSEASVPGYAYPAFAGLGWMIMLCFPVNYILRATFRRGQKAMPSPKYKLEPVSYTADITPVQGWDRFQLVSAWQYSLWVWKSNVKSQNVFIRTVESFAKFLWHCITWKYYAIAVAQPASPAGYKAEPYLIVMNWFRQGNETIYTRDTMHKADQNGHDIDVKSLVFRSGEAPVPAQGSIKIVSISASINTETQ